MSSSIQQGLAREDNIPSIDRTLIFINSFFPSLVIQPDDTAAISTNPKALCIDGVAEYARILYDLFPLALLKACVGAQDNGEHLQHLNSWFPSQQSVQRILEGFGTAKFVSSAPSAEENNESAFTSAVKALVENEEGSLKKVSHVRGRLILLLPHEHFHPICDQIINTVNKAIKSLSIPLVCELVILFLSEDIKSSDHINTTKRISPQLDCHIVTSSYSKVRRTLDDMAVKHFRLRAIRITGIPMKEKDSSVKGEVETRSIYDVILLHAAGSHLYKQPFLIEEEQNSSSSDQQPPSDSGLSILDKEKKRELVLQWRTGDRRTNSNTLSCKCIHRITPLDIYSNPSTCLMKHVCSSGKPVTLAPPSSNSPASISHALLLHNGDVWLHCMHWTIPLDSLPPTTLSAYTKNDRYRVDEFVKIMNDNILSPSTPNVKKDAKSQFIQFIPTSLLVSPPVLLSNPQSPQQLFQGGVASQFEKVQQTYVCPKPLEKPTRFFPLSVNDTLLFAAEHSSPLESILDPLKQILLTDEVEEGKLELATELVAKIFQYSMQNEVQLFPQIAQNTAARQEVYRRLWLELLNFVRRCIAFSPKGNHSKICAIMERLWPDLSGLPIQEVVTREESKEEKDIKENESNTNTKKEIDGSGRGESLNQKLKNRDINPKDKLPPTNRDGNTNPSNRNRDPDRPKEEPIVTHQGGDKKVKKEGSTKVKSDPTPNQPNVNTNTNFTPIPSNGNPPIIQSNPVNNANLTQNINNNMDGRHNKDRKEKRSFSEMDKGPREINNNVNSVDNKKPKKNQKERRNDASGKSLFASYWSNIKGGKGLPVRDFDGRANEQ